jgi:hypothetical protein
VKIFSSNICARAIFKASELAVEQPKKFEFIINLRAAK